MELGYDGMQIALVVRLVFDIFAGNGQHFPIVESIREDFCFAIRVFQDCPELLLEPSFHLVLQRILLRQVKPVFLSVVSYTHQFELGAFEIFRFLGTLFRDF